MEPTGLVEFPPGNACFREDSRRKCANLCEFKMLFLEMEMIEKQAIEETNRISVCWNERR